MDVTDFQALPHGEGHFVLSADSYLIAIKSNSEDLSQDHGAMERRRRTYINMLHRVLGRNFAFEEYMDRQVMANEVDEGLLETILATRKGFTNRPLHVTAS